MQWPLVGREAAFGHAVGLVDSRTGIALLGPAGVGKSRLLHELADRAEQGGYTVVRTVASVSTRSIPFGPFVDLLPGGPTQDRLSMLGAAITGLVERSNSGDLLLTVDDAHHLDETSLAFLVSVVTSQVATVAITARSGEPMPGDLVDLWTNGVIERLDMGPLGRSDVRLLLQARLGEVSLDLEEELWRLAAGNPLVLHELIEGAIGRAIVQDDEDGTWVRAGSLATSARLTDLVNSRLHSLPGEARQSMDVLAVGSPLPLAIAREALGENLPLLEQSSHAVIVDDGGDGAVVPAHPLYGEILESNIGEERSRASHRQLVEAAVRLDSIADPLRVALWQLASGEILSDELALAGARQALVRHEPGLTEEILSPLGTEDDRVALLLGRALSYRQRFDEAEALLSQHELSDEALLGEITSIRAQNLGFGLGRVDEARDLLHEVAGNIQDPDLRARLINERAMVSAIHGDFVDSMASSEQVLSDPHTSAVSRGAAYVTLTVALAMTGDCDRMDAVVDDALDVAEEAKEMLPFARDQIGVMRMSSALHAGRISEALELCDEALEPGRQGNAMTTTWLTASVMAHELSGQLKDARSAAAEALELFGEADPFGLEAQARGVTGLVAGQMGESVPDDNYGLNHPQAGPRLTVWLARGRAWSAAARGEIEAAVEAALEGGRGAMAGEHYAWAAFCFSDVVRFDRSDLVVEELRGIDCSNGALLLDAIRQHAEASVARSPERLDLVSRRFAGFGCWLLAAEGFARASALFDSAGDTTKAARCVALSMVAEGRCQSPRTAALDARRGLVTPRELEVALDAAAGLTSPQISEKRYISVRTVDNHLSSVYRKLSLSGRDELAVLFAVQ